jgi:uncharacterized protein
MYEINKLDCDEVEWDPDKNTSNIAKHGIDFSDAFNALRSEHLERDSSKNGEVRTLAICWETRRIIAVVYQMRSDVCRIISARVARENERREYRSVFGRRDH